tara:strand:+ start:1570 stop:1812 length:243 start_codon:yes stop_codon:yes gene_type:complete
MGYIIAPIQFFVDKDNTRADAPSIFTASDDRSYTKVVLSEDCPKGVKDFSDGECYTLYASVEDLNSLEVGEKVRVTAREE